MCVYVKTKTAQKNFKPKSHNNSLITFYYSKQRNRSILLPLSNILMIDVKVHKSH
jgi:hypothetical protein